MRTKSSSIFTSIGFLVFSIIFVLGSVFIIMTYLSATHYYQATTQRLNKDVAAHIAKFTSPYSTQGLDRRIADSVFHDAMVLSPTIEVYFLDTTGNVMYYQAPDSAIQIRKIPLEKIKTHIQSQGMDYIKGPDPKNPETEQVFSAAEVKNDSGMLGYIYVILGSNEYRKVSQSLFDNHVLLLSIKVFAIIIVLSLLLSLLYIRRIRNNFRKIKVVLDQYKNGNYTTRLKTGNYNEFSSIAEGFNNMAESLVYTIERLESSAKERKDFLANISHDLRTPLSIARGYIETLKDEIRKNPVDAEKQEAFVQLAAKKIHQLESMVHQLFDLSRMESIEFMPVKEPFIISDIIEETVNTARAIADEKNITIACYGCQNSYWINADTGMMERLVQNLVYNAVKYTPENGYIKVSLVRNDSQLEISIGNSGVPFTGQLLEWINRKDTGKVISGKPHAGLGLAIVIKILQLHDYTYEASVDTKGNNVFFFSIPIYNK
jgi:signal transduction histidine kinase